MFLIVWFAASTLLVGCAKCSKIDAIGTFKSNRQQNESLQVNADGSYLHRYEDEDRSEDGDDNKIEVSEKGAWSFEMDHGVPRLVFENFSFGNEQGKKISAIWSVEIVRTIDSIRLGINEDLNQYFEK